MVVVASFIALAKMGEGSKSRLSRSRRVLSLSRSAASGGQLESAEAAAAWTASMSSAAVNVPEGQPSEEVRLLVAVAGLGRETERKFNFQILFFIPII